MMASLTMMTYIKLVPDFVHASISPNLFLVLFLSALSSYAGGMPRMVRNVGKSTEARGDDWPIMR